MNVRRLGALVSILALSVAAVPRITVNDKPLDIAPISENGRVLVPMRAIFESLGAQLTYDAHTHTISADGNGHAVQLQIGNPSALVDNRAVDLDVPARIVGASTYVPLRFVAQSLGAVVGYDNATSLVTVSLGDTTITSSASGSERVGSMLPAPNTSVGTGYPTISAVIGGDVPVANANLTVDGVDVTDATTFDGTSMTYIPQEGLAVGTHEVTLSGTDQDNVAFGGTWSFTTDVAPAPNFGSSIPFQFSLENGGGIYGYGDEMNFILQGPPGGRAYLTTCASSQPIWLNGSGSYYRGSVRAPYGFNSGYCPIEAVYIGLNGQIWYAPMPIFAHLRPRSYYNNGGYGNGGYGNGGYHGGRPHNRPTPRPTPNHWPPKPTPSPSAAPHQPWPGQTPAPPIARPPHRPMNPPTPQPQQTQAPRPEPVATQPPQPQATQAPPQARPPRRPRPVPTEAPAPERTDAPAPAQTDAPAPAQTDAPAPPPRQPETPHIPEPRPLRTPAV